MACVRLRHRRRPVGSGVADENGDTVRCSQRIGIDTQLCGQLLVEHQQPGRRAPAPPATARTSPSGHEQRSCRTRTVAGPRRSPTQGYRAAAGQPIGQWRSALTQVPYLGAKLSPQLQGIRYAADRRYHDRRYLIDRPRSKPNSAGRQRSTATPGSPTRFPGTSITLPAQSAACRRCLHDEG